jgi:F-type H+-transporting ATPase subunit epsilon
MPKINFKIVTPERVVYEADIDQVTLPTASGEITVLPNHIPLVSLLAAGELVIKIGEKIIPLAVAGGFVEVGKNKVVILADSADKVEEIDAARVEEARKRAEEILKTKKIDSEEYATFAGHLERELARLKVARKHRKSAPTSLPHIEE